MSVSGNSSAGRTSNVIDAQLIETAKKLYSIDVKETNQTFLFSLGETFLAVVLWKVNKTSFQI